MPPKGLPPFAPALLGLYPDPGLPQFEDSCRLLKLGKSPADLPDHDPSRVGTPVGLINETALVGGIELDALGGKPGNQKFLHHQIASQPVEPFDNNDVGLRGEKSGQGWAFLDGAGDPFLSNVGSDLETVNATEAFDLLLLPEETIAVDLALATDPHVAVNCHGINIGQDRQEVNTSCLFFYLYRASY